MTPKPPAAEGPIEWADVGIKFRMWVMAADLMRPGCRADLDRALESLGLRAVPKGEPDKLRAEAATVAERQREACVAYLIRQHPVGASLYRKTVEQTPLVTDSPDPEYDRVGRVVRAVATWTAECRAALVKELRERYPETLPGKKTSAIVVGGDKSRWFGQLGCFCCTRLDDEVEPTLSAIAAEIASWTVNECGGCGEERFRHWHDGNDLRCGSAYDEGTFDPAPQQTSPDALSGQGTTTAPQGGKELGQPYAEPKPEALDGWTNERLDRGCWDEGIENSMADGLRLRNAVIAEQRRKLDALERALIEASKSADMVPRSELEAAQRRYESSSAAFGELSARFDVQRKDNDRLRAKCSRQRLELRRLNRQHAAVIGNSVIVMQNEARAVGALSAELKRRVQFESELATLRQREERLLNVVVEAARFVSAETLGAEARDPEARQEFFAAVREFLRIDSAGIAPVKVACEELIADARSLRELVAALPKCGAFGCDRVATSETDYLFCCDRHPETTAEELPYAAVVRRIQA